MKRDITLVSQEKIKYKLIFSESFITLNLNDSIIVPLVTEDVDWTLKLVFEDNQMKKNLSANLAYEGNEIFYTMYNWYSDNLIENSSPIKLSSNGTPQIDFFLKLKTSGNNKSTNRLVTISIWQQINRKPIPPLSPPKFKKS